MIWDAAKNERSRNASGWKVVLTPRVPSLTCDAVAPAFEELVQSIHGRGAAGSSLLPQDFDWALHPGGSTIITGVQKTMGITEDHLRASYDIYMNYGNSSSATIMSVLRRLTEMGDGRRNVLACAFGPGISMEMMVLRRTERQNLTNGDTHVNGHEQTNGHAVSSDVPTVDGMPQEDLD